jgi:hypothetical protein
MSDESKDPNEKRDRIVGNIVKTFGVIFAIVGLIVVLGVGLLLGACFLHR